MSTPIVEIAPLTGAEYEYDYQQLNRLKQDDIASYCGALRQRLAPVSRSDGATEEWIARTYLSIKFILASTLMLSSAEFASKTNLRIVAPYLVYYALFNISRSFVLMVPEHAWDDGALASETTHTKVLNVTHDYFRRLSPDIASRYQTISQRALKTRELFSYSFPALGFSSSPESAPPDLEDVIEVCQAVAELAQLHSECVQSAFRRVPPVTLDKRSKTLRKLYEYEHRSGGSSFADSEDWYRLWQIERHVDRPLSLHAMARQGLVEDFFGAWNADDANHAHSFNSDKIDWQLIFDFM
jgi:hypothetical protein